MSLCAEALRFESIKTIMLEKINFCIFCLKVTLSVVTIRL